MKRNLLIGAAGLLVLLFTSLIFKNMQTQSPVQETADVVVAVSIPPYVPIVSAVTGSSAEVFSIVPVGYSPETYEPTPLEMQRLESADVVVFNGDLPFEEALRSQLTTVNPDAQILALNTALSEEDMLHLEEHGHEEPDQEEEHEEEARDPHTWLSPRLVAKQVPLVVTALSETNPSAANEYQQHGAALIQSLEQVSADIAQKLAPFQGKAFLVYHPAFGYFAEEFGLEQRYIEVEGKEPSAVQLKEHIAALADTSVSVIFIEPQFSTRTAESLADELALSVQTVDPLSTQYLENLYVLAESFSR